MVPRWSRFYFVLFFFVRFGVAHRPRLLPCLALSLRVGPLFVFIFPFSFSFSSGVLLLVPVLAGRMAAGLNTVEFLGFLAQDNP